MKTFTLIIINNKIQGSLMSSKTTSSAVAVIADCTAYDIWYSENKLLSGIVVVSMGYYLFTV